MEYEKKFSPLHRIIHWTMAIAMSVQLFTGFLRMVWMDKRFIAGVITGQTPGLDIPQKTLFQIAALIREPMFQWHVLFAKVMMLAILVRIIYMLVYGIRFPNPFKKKMDIKVRLQGFTYVYFYVFVLISAVTGFLLEFDFFPNLHKTVEGIHKWGLYWFPIFLLLHAAGVLVAEFTNRRGIVSHMISGVEQER